MKNKFKQTLSLFLIVAMTLGTFGAATLNVSAEENQYIETVAEESQEVETGDDATEAISMDSAVEITESEAVELVNDSSSFVDAAETTEAETPVIDESETGIEDCENLSQYILQEGGYKELEITGGEQVSRAANLSGAGNALLKAMKSRKSSVNLKSYKVPRTQMNALIVDVMNSNPDLFYASVKYFEYDKSSNIVLNCYFQYTGTSADIIVYNDAVEDAYAEALPNPSGMTDLQKALVLHDYLAQHIEYDQTENTTRYTAYDAFVNGLTVCQGYTMAYRVLLEKAGIEVDYCYSESMNHIWNYIKIGGSWYHVDVTWDDPVKDNLGYVSHTYFMNSDSKITENGHYSWIASKTCSNTQYDSNMYWLNSLSAVHYVNGKEYYLKSLDKGTIYAMVVRSGNTETNLFTVSATWNVWGSTAYYTGLYATLSYYDGMFYFHDTKNIYVVKPGGGSSDVRAVCSYSASDGYIYGILVKDGKIYFDIAQKSHSERDRCYTDTPLKALSVKASTRELTYGYSTSATLTSSVTKGSIYTGTPSYQWYKITTSSGTTTETAISGATKSTYTVQSGLAIGIYTYRVKATLNGQVRSADIVILVRKANSESLGTENVYRVYGSDRYGTSFKTADVYKAQLGVSQFSSVILAYGKNFPDALAGSYLSSVKFAPILMVNTSNSSSLKSYINANLKAGGTVYVLGGESAIPSSILSGLSGYTIKRLAGADRYSTNLKILKETGVTNEEIVVCTGSNFADSLSASALGKPILLVSSSLTTAQKNYLSSLSTSKYYIIGGSKAVSDGIANTIRNYGTTSRVYGADRYETSISVAKAFFGSSKTAVLAYAKNFPDGLCGGPLAMSKHAPLILTATGKESVAVKYANTKGITTGAVLGGPGLISDNAVNKIFSSYSIAIWE